MFLFPKMNSSYSREHLVDSNSADNEYLVVGMESSTSVTNDGTTLLDTKETGSPSLRLIDSSTFRNENKTKMPTKGFSKRRLVKKNGELKVLAKNVPGKTRRYLADIFTTMIDLRWKWVMFIFASSYIISWTMFGFIWWLVAILRGSSVCISKVDNWTAAFLFSLETQETIGYGEKSVTTKCPEAIIILQLQSLVGLLIDAFMLGLTFAKLSRPRERMKTVMFSKYAVIAPRDGKMCLMFRVGDIRKSQIVDPSMRLQLFRPFTTKEGKEISFHQEDLKICYDWNDPDNDFRNKLFLMLPVVIIHVIDEKSPFYDLTPECLQEREFEIVAMLDGMVEHTGLNTQPRTSYLNSEILWGYDFFNMLEKSHFSKDGFYNVDFSRLDDVHVVEMPSYSPREYYRRQQHVEN